MMHDLHYILSAFLKIINPELVITDRLEDINTGRNMVAIPHQFIPNNKYTQARVFINQDIDNKELASFLMSAEITRSRLSPRPEIVQSRMDGDFEVEYLATYIIKFDVLTDEILGLQQEDGTFVTPHALNLNINITKLKEEIL